MSGTSSIAKYSYFVVLFEISIVGLFTYLYVDNQNQIDTTCETIPLNTWWIVSLSTAYAGCLISFFLSLIKELSDYKTHKNNANQYPSIQHGKSGVLGIIKTVSPIVSLISVVYILLLVFFNVWGVIGAVFLILDSACVEHDLYLIFVIWLVLGFCSAFMSVCCCFCTCSSLVVHTSELVGAHRLTSFVRGYEFKEESV